MANNEYKEFLNKYITAPYKDTPSYASKQEPITSVQSSNNSNRGTYQDFIGKYLSGNFTASATATSPSAPSIPKVNTLPAVSAPKAATGGATEKAKSGNIFKGTGSRTYEGFTGNQKLEYDALLRQLDEADKNSAYAATVEQADEYERYKQQLIAQLDEMDKKAGRAAREYTASGRIGDVLAGWGNKTRGSYSGAAGSLLDIGNSLHNASSAEQRAVVDSGYAGWATDELSAANIAESARINGGTGIEDMQKERDRLYAKADAQIERGNYQTNKAKYGTSAVGEMAIDAVQTGLDVAADAAFAMATGASGLLPMAARVYGSEAQQARLEGDDVGTAAAKGIKSAAIEVFTELIGGPFEGIYGKSIASKAFGKATGVLDKVLQNGAVRFALSTASEGGEEWLSDVLNLLIDHAAGWAEEGVSLGEDWSAQREQRLYDALLGAIVGGFGATVESVQGRQADNYTKQKYAGQEESIINHGLSDAGENATMSRYLAEQAQSKIADGGELTGKELRRMLETYEEEGAPYKSWNREEMLASVNGNIANNRRSNAEFNSDAQSANKQLVGSAVTGKATPYLRQTDAEPFIYGRGYSIPAQTESAEETDTGKAASEVGGDTSAKDINVPDAERSAESKGKTVTDANDGRTEQRTDSNRSEKPTSSEPVTIEKAAKKYGRQAGAYEHTYQQGQDVAKYDEAYRAAYNYGMSGVPFDKVRDFDSVSYLTEGQREAAYMAGSDASSANASRLAEKNKAAAKNKGDKWNSGTVKYDGEYKGKGTVKGVGVKLGEISKTFNDTQKTAYRVLSRVAEATGINIVLYKSEADADGKFRATQGEFNRNDPGTIYIDLNAGLFSVNDVSDLGKYTMLYTFSHEFTHFVEKWNPVKYNELRKTVFEEMTKNGHDVDLLIQARMDSTGLSYEAASREVVAESMTEILPQASFVETLYNEHKSLFEQIADKLKQFVEDIKSYFSINGGETLNANVTALKSNIDGAMKYAENIINLFDNVAKEAVENYQMSIEGEEAERKPAGADWFRTVDEPDEEAPSLRDMAKKPETVSRDRFAQNDFTSTEEAAPNLKGMADRPKQVSIDRFTGNDFDSAEEAAPSLRDMAKKPETVSRDRFAQNDFTSAEERGENLLGRVDKVKAETEGSVEEAPAEETVAEIIEEAEAGKAEEAVPSKTETEEAKAEIKQEIRNTVKFPVETNNDAALETALKNKELSIENITLQGNVDGFNKFQRAYIIENIIKGHYAGGKEISLSIPYDGKLSIVNSPESVLLVLKRLGAKVNQEILFDKKLDRILRGNERNFTLKLKNQGFVSDSYFAVAMPESALEYATDKNTYNAQQATEEQTKFVSGLLETESKPVSQMPDIGTAREYGKTLKLYVFDTGTGKAYFNQKYVDYLDGKSFRLSENGLILTAYNEDGTIAGFALGMRINGEVTIKGRANLKSFKNQTTAAKNTTERKASAKEKPTAKEAKQTKTQSETKLNDFGEKIGGARKDWRSEGLYSDDLEDMNGRERKANVKKDNVWKRPDYKKLISAGESRAVLFARNEIRKSLNANIAYMPSWNEERTKQKQQQYVDTIREIQALTEKASTKADFENMLNLLHKNGYLEKTGIYGLSTTDKWRGDPALFGSNYVQTLNYIIKNFSNLERLADRKNFAVEKNEQIPAGFKITQNSGKDGSWYITKGSFIIRDNIPSYEEALKLLQDAQTRKTKKTRFIPEQLLQINRTGPDYRGGKNVDGQAYIDTFGFKGGEYGNWMTQKDRRVSLNYGYDALMDLSDALGVPATDISFGGNLNIAFGARGQGLSGAVAHYEPMRHVINLTKMNGAGSLAHEWFHALDDFIGGYNERYATDSYYHLPDKTKEAVRNLVQTMRYKDQTAEENDLARQRVVERNERRLSNYLSDWFRWTEKLRKGTLTEADTRYFKRTPTAADVEKFDAIKARLMNGETAAINELSDLKKEITGHVIDKESRTALNYTVMSLTPESRSQTVTGRKQTDFYNGSQEFDKLHTKDGDYWSSTIEMSARAFACYVTDKTGKNSDYLSAHSDRYVALSPDKDGNFAVVRAFPIGEERKAINKAFDELFDALKADGYLHQAEETEKPAVTSYENKGETTDEEGNETQYQERTSQRPERDRAYMNAVDSGKTDVAQSMVEKAAYEAGAILDRNGRPRMLYHGTPRFGFTEFDMSSKTKSDGMVYATTKATVAANYGGANRYAGARNIGKKLRNGNSVNDIIHNAESVLGQKYHAATAEDRKKTASEVIEQAQEVADTFNDLYDYMEYMPGWNDTDRITITDEYGFETQTSPSNCFDWIVSLFYSATAANINDSYAFNEDGTGREDWRSSIKEDLARFNEMYEPFRQYLGEVHGQIKNTPAKKIYDAMTSLKLRDAATLIQYRLLNATAEGDMLVNTNGSFQSAAELAETIERNKDIGAYKLYGFAGDNMLTVDANNGEWYNMKFSQLGPGVHTTDEIGRWAKENGYTSVLVKNVQDGGITANEYIFFDANQLKSADPVTYDDDGNVIPLSERFDDERRDIRYSSRQTNTRDARLTDREVLSMAANDVDIEGLDDGEKDALRIFQQRLTNLYELEQKRVEEGQKYKEQMFGKNVDRAATEKTRNRMQVLDQQIEKARADVLKVEKTEVLRRVLQKSRKIVEQKEREHGEELLERYRDRRKNAAAIKKYKQRVIDETDRLYDMLMHPSNKDANKRVPDAIRKTVRDLIESINFESKRSLRGGEATKADRELARRMAALQRAIKDNIDIVGAYSGYADLPQNFMDDFTRMTELFNKLADLQGGTFIVNQMSSQELKTLSELLRNIRSYIQNMNRFHENAMFEHADEGARNTIEHLRPLSRAVTKLLKAGPLDLTRVRDQFLQWQYMRPSQAFKRFGEGGMSIHKEFQDGQATQAFLAKKIIDFTNATYTAAEVKKWSEDTITVKLSSGKMLTMPVAHAMSFYCLSKREQALTHLYGDGIRVAAFTSNGKQYAEQGTLISVKDLMNINSALAKYSKKAVEVADKLQKYMSTDCAEWGNYVSLKRFGTQMFGEENYFPINSDGRHLAATADEGPDGAGLYALLNMGFTKELKQNASNRIVIYNVFDVFANHTASMTQYRAFALPVLDALKWFNYKEDFTSVRDVMAKAFGTPPDTRPGSGAKSYAEQFVINLLKSYNGTSQHGDTYDGTMLKQLHLFNRAQIAYNVRVYIQQPMAITRAEMVLDGSKLRAGLLKAAANYKQLAAEMEKYSGIAVWKSLGFYDTNISRGLTSLIKHDETMTDTVLEIGTKPAELADRYTWAAMWSAAKDSVSRKGKTDEEYFKEVTELFERCIYETQVVDSVLTKSEFLRSQSFAAKTLGSFMSEPSTTISMLVGAATKYTDDIARGKSRTQAWQANRDVLMKTFRVYAVGQILLAAVQAAIDGLRDDDDYETYPQKWWEAFKGNMVEELLPFGKIPVVQDLYSLYKLVLSKFGVDTYGYLPSSGYMQYAEYLVKAADILGDKMQGKKNGYTYYAVTYNLMRGVSGMTGLPFANLTRTVVGIWNPIIGAFKPEWKLKTYDPNKQTAIGSSYKSGNMRRENAIEALKEDAGLDADKAKAYLDYMDFQRKYPRSKLSQTKALGWDQYVKASGMSMKDFEKLVNDTDDTQASVGAYIKEHKITVGQANAIFKAFGWKTTYSEWLAKAK